MLYENSASQSRPPFPTYLLPSFSFPFRRRPSSTITTYSESSLPSLSNTPTSSANTTPSSSPPSATFFSHHGNRKGKEILHEDQETEAEPQAGERLYRAQPDTLKCATCATDIAFASQIVSKGFTGRHGRAYLVSAPCPSSSNPNSKLTELINTKVGRAVNRQLVTGAHVVADINCVICQTVVGWKYVNAKEAGQRYKIGKFILETKRVVCHQRWEDGRESDENARLEEKEGEDENGEAVVVFDSEDEDECEDLFAGIWDVEVVAKRRSRRVGTRRKMDAAT